MFVKAAKQNLSSDELQSFASKAVLATLCVPFQKDSGMQSSLELTSDGGSSAFEKAKKHAALFSAQSVPTRESICSSLIEKGLLQLSAGPVQKLFALVESEFTPLSLCQDAKPFLDEIGKGELFDGALTQYVTPLKQIIFFRLMKQLSEVYSNMTIDNFEQAASIVPFNIAEKWMANAARQHGINIQINYQHQAIVFGAPRKVDMKSMRQPLMEIGHKLQTAMNRVAPEESGKKEKLEKQQLSANIVKRIEEESHKIRQRKEEIERRKEESERKRQEKEKEALEKQRRQEAKDAEAEKVRQEEERRRREAERAEQKRKEAELNKNKEMLEQMKKQADSAKAANLKVGGKKITEIEADDLENIGIDKIEKAREAQVLRERQDKIRNRKMESKRVDHLARALREEEVPMTYSWADQVEEEDAEFLEKATAKNVEEQREKHTVDLKERDYLIIFQKAKDEWQEGLMEDRYGDFEQKRKAQIERLTQKVVDGKIARAKKRLADDRLNVQKVRDEEENRRAAEERRRADEARRAEQERLDEERRAEEERDAAERREREEVRRREAEEKRREQDEMRARAEAKRVERERELEARQSERATESRAPARDAPAPRDDGNSWRRGGDAPREEASAPWRRGQPAPERAPGAERNQGGRTPGGGGDGDSWRRPGGDDRGDAPRGGARPAATNREEDSWRRGPAPDSDAPRGGARPQPREGGGESNAWRRPERPAGGGGDEGSWRQGGARGGAPAPRDDDGPRRAPAPRDDDGPRRAPAPRDDDGPRRSQAPKEEAAPVEDDGWGVVSKAKRRTGGAQPAGDEGNWRSGGGAPAQGQNRAPGAGRGEDSGSWRAPGGPRGGAPPAADAEKRPVPPWKRNAANN